MFKTMFNRIALGPLIGAAKSSGTCAHDTSPWECLHLPRARPKAADADGFILVEASRDTTGDRSTDVHSAPSDSSAPDVAKSPALGFEVVDAHAVWEDICVSSPDSPASDPQHVFDLFEHEEEQSPALSDWITLGPSANASTELFRMESDDDTGAHSSTEPYQMDAEDDIWSDSDEDVGTADGVPFLKLSRRTLASPEATPEVSATLTIGPSSLLLAVLESARKA